MLTKEPRFRFVSDDDGHDYLIPADKESAFDEWMEYSDVSDEWSGEDFTDCRIDYSMNCYTFTNPKLDEGI